MAERPRETIERLSDVGEWGEKDVRGAYSSPLRIAGELVDVEKLPPLGDVDRLPPLGDGDGPPK